MSYVNRRSVTVTTDAAGDATAYIGALTGRILNIIYAKTDFADGVDFVITGETTGIGLWSELNVNAAKTVSPRQPTHTQAGVVNATAGDVLQGDIYLAQERVKIVIAAGGNAKSGTFSIIIEGPTG